MEENQNRQEILKKEYKGLKFPTPEPSAKP
jgi:hypothetical protein